MAAINTCTKLVTVLSHGSLNDHKMNSRRNLRVQGMAITRGGVRCSLKEEEKKSSNRDMSLESSMVGSMIALASAAIATTAGPAMALVDERLSTEGTGLPFGLSNNLLGWILLGVFGLTWTFYFTYASSLDEDEDSGLSL